MAISDKFPRLLNLVILLLNAKKPISLDEIARRLGGFPDSAIAKRQAFERAKKELRDMGIPIATHPIPGSEQYGYLINESEMIIPDLRLTKSEASALAAASAIVRFGNGTSESALAKLGCVIADEEVTIANVPTIPALFTLYEAMGFQKAVQFSYRNKLRTLDIFGVTFKWGNWYLIGLERESGQVKTFLVNLIGGDIAVTDLPAQPKPEGFDFREQLPKNHWEIGDGSKKCTLIRFDPDMAPIVEYLIDGDFELKHNMDSSVNVSMEVVDEKSFFEWFLEYSDKAVLLAPEEVVVNFKHYLEVVGTSSLAEGLRNELLRLAESKMAEKSGNFNSPSLIDISDARTNMSLKDGLRTSAEMYTALEKILPWLAIQKSTTVKEISTKFGISNNRVVRLLEIASCCGLPPYTPDSLLEIIVEDDGTVTSYLEMDLITSPRVLNILEVMVLATTASAALNIPGIDPSGQLSSALTKLQSSLKEFRMGISGVEVNIEEPYFLPQLREAANSRWSVEITYYSASSERITQRIVDPYLIFSDSERWYLRGFCHLSHEVRHFAVGRIISCQVNSNTFEIPERERFKLTENNIPSAYDGRGEIVVVAVLSVNKWRLERYVASPNLLIDHGEYSVYEIEYSSLRWLSGLLMRLGRDIEVLKPTSLVDLKDKTTLDLLEKYQSTH